MEHNNIFEELEQMGRIPLICPECKSFCSGEKIQNFTECPYCKAVKRTEEMKQLFDSYNECLNNKTEEISEFDDSRPMPVDYGKNVDVCDEKENESSVFSIEREELYKKEDFLRNDDGLPPIEEDEWHCLAGKAAEGENNEEYDEKDYASFGNVNTGKESEIHFTPESRMTPMDEKDFDNMCLFIHPVGEKLNRFALNGFIYDKKRRCFSDDELSFTKDELKEMLILTEDWSVMEKFIKNLTDDHPAVNDCKSHEEYIDLVRGIINDYDQDRFAFNYDSFCSEKGLCPDYLYKVEIEKTDDYSQYKRAGYYNELPINNEPVPEGTEIKIIISDRIKKIERSLFASMDGIVTIEIESGAPGRIIEPETFKDCTEIKRVNIGEGIYYVGAFSFSGCTSLSVVIFPDNGLNQIGKFAFDGCISLQAVELPDCVQVGISSFMGCKNLRYINLFRSDNVNSQYYDDKAIHPDRKEKFRKIIEISKKMNAPSELMNLDDETKALLEYPEDYIPEEINNSGGYLLGSSFEDCTSLEAVYIPSGVVRVYCQAFMGCRSLKKLFVSDSVAIIDKTAFIGCPDVEVVFPDEIPSNNISKDYGEEPIPLWKQDYWDDSDDSNNYI